jgi:hypothetical protein
LARWPCQFLPDLPGAASSPIHPEHDGRSGGWRCRPSPNRRAVQHQHRPGPLAGQVDSADLEKSLARVKDNGVITYTLASRNEGETFQSLTINGKNLVTYVITEEADPDPAKTRSRYDASGF